MAMTLDSKVREFREERERKARERISASLSRLMQQEDGKEILWYILDHTGYHAPELWEAGVGINRKVAYRDFGSWLIHEMAAANEEAFFQLQRVFRVRAIQEQLALEKFETEQKEKR